jgi:hypothetical protein
VQIEHYISKPTVFRRVQLIESDLSDIQALLIRGSVLSRDPSGIWTVPYLSSGTFERNDNDWIQIFSVGYVSPSDNWSGFQLVDGPSVEYTTS